MPQARVPHIGPEWTLVPHDPDTVELRTGVWNSQTLTLHDDSAQGHLWPALKGLRAGRPAREIAAEVGVPARDVESLIDHLVGLDVIVDEPRSALDTFIGGAANGRGDVPAPSRLVFAGANPIHDRVAADLRDHLECPIETLEPGAPLLGDLTGSSPDRLADGLEIERLRERFADLAGAFVVCARPRNHPLWFGLVDDVAHAVGFTWLHATIDGPFVYVGPTVVPNRTAGYRTFETRVSMNIRESASYLAYKEALAERQVLEAAAGVFGPLAGMLAGHVALEVTNWFATGSNFTVNKVLGIYLPTMEIAYHEVLPLPGERNRPRQNRDAPSLYFDIREWYADGRVAES